MQKITAELKYLRMSPSKVQIVARELKGKKAEEALLILGFLGKKAAHPLSKLIKSAIANAENNFNLKKEDLKIEKIEVLKGPMYKRWRPRSRGMAHPILKRTTHLKLFLVQEDLPLEAEKRQEDLKKAKGTIKKSTSSEKELPKKKDN